MTTDLPWWVPEDFSQIVFTNCTAVAKFNADFSTTNDLPIISMANLFVDGFNTYWTANNIERPLASELSSYIFNQFMDVPGDLAKYTLKEADKFVSNCRLEYCQFLPWQGNADLSGRGVRETPVKKFSWLTAFLDADILFYTSHIGDILHDHHSSREIEQVVKNLQKGPKVPTLASCGPRIGKGIPQRFSTLLPSCASGYLVHLLQSCVQQRGPHDYLCSILVGTHLTLHDIPCRCVTRRCIRPTAKSKI